MKNLKVLILLISVLFIFGQIRVYSQSIGLDTSFNQIGIKRLVLERGFDKANMILQQPDGKLMVVGIANVGIEVNIALSRLLPNGSNDMSYGKNGLILSGVLGGNNFSLGLSAALQPDGKILVCGAASNDDKTYHFMVARYDQNGALDNSFNGSGFNVIKMGSKSYANAIEIAPDGTIIIAGDANINNSNEMVAVRLKADGVLDLGFGSSGIASIGPKTGSCSDLALYSNGSIVLAGYSTDANYYTNFTIAKLSSSGKLDKSFDQDGIAILDVGGYDDYAYATTIQEDGKILVTGSSTDQNYLGKFVIVRLSASGALDNSFDKDGKLILSNNNLRNGYGIQVQPDGKIVAVGIAKDNQTSEIDIAAIRVSSAGVLDNTFSNGGVALLDISKTQDFASSIIIQKDGGILIGGYNESTSIIAKYNSTGIIDNNFGKNGVKLLNLNQSHSINTSVKIQADGKILAGGYASSNRSFGYVSARIMKNGAIDTSYSNDGVAEGFLFSNQLYSSCMQVQSDNKLLMGGYAVNSTSDNTYTLIRFEANGSIDASFGNSGRVTTDVGISDDRITCMALQTDNKILAAGYSYNGQNWDFSIVRYLANGSLDLTFSGDGKLITPFGNGDDGAQAIAIQKDGKILVGGFAVVNNEFKFAVMRYTSQGVLDMTFNNSGKLTLDVSPQGDEILYAIKVQEDGKIILTGDAFNGTNTDFAVARITSNGNLDNSFSDDGLNLIDINSNYNDAIDLVVLPNGKIMIGGTCVDSGFYAFALVRLLPDGRLDMSFGRDGIAILSVGPEDDIAAALALQNDGKTIISGSSVDGARIEFAIARVLSNLNVGNLDEEAEASAMFVYPNPIQSEAQLEYTLKSDDKLSLQLVDMDGRELQMLYRMEPKSAGFHSEPVYLNQSLPDGNYVLNLVTSKGTVGIKVNKKSR